MAPLPLVQSGDSEMLTKLQDAAAPAVTDRPLVGIVYLCLGVFVFSLQDVIMKSVSGNLSLVQVVFVRSVISLPLSFMLVLWEGKVGQIGRIASLPITFRGFLLFCSFFGYYMALAALPLAEAVALSFTAPLLITVLSVPVLGERVGWRRITAVLVGFLGVLIIVQPGSRVFEPASLFILFSASCYGSAQLFTRRMGAQVSGSVMSFYAAVVYSVLGGLLGLLFGGSALVESAHPSLQFLFRPWAWLQPLELGIIAVLGVIVTLGAYCLTQAYRVAEPNKVTAFEYTGLLWGLLWGYLVWHQVPSPIKLAGIGLIAASGLYILVREARLRRSGRLTAGGQRDAKASVAAN